MIERYESLRRHPESTDGGRPRRSTFKIAKHHFPLCIVEDGGKWGKWTSPMTMEEVEKLGCYPNMNPQDSLLRYDTGAGEGCSGEWKKKHPGALFIKAPRASHREVKAVVEQWKPNHNSNRNSNRINLGDIRKSHEQAQDQKRSAEEWRGMIHERDEANESLKRQLEEKQQLLEEREQSIKALRRKSNNAIEKKRYAAKRAKVNLEKEEIDDHVDYGSEVTYVQFQNLLAKAGGLSRLTIFNDDWHKEHKDAAKLLWGYQDWNETKLYIDAYFPGEVNVNYDPSMHVTVGKDDNMQLPPLTPFEKCLICRMFFRTLSRQTVLGLCIDKHRTRIGQILKEWAPKWANVGLDLGCLDITSDYLFKEQPNRNIRLHSEWLVFVDGKDWLIGPKQNDSVIPKETFSSKTEKDSARGVTYSTATGVIFEFSPLFGAHAGERELNRLMGSQGPVHAPVEQWKDVAKNDPWTPEDDTFWTALSDVLTAKEYEAMVEQIEEGGPLVSIGPPEDGVLITGQPTGLERIGLRPADADTDSNESHGSDSSEEKSAKGVFGIADALSEYETMVKMKAVEAALKESGSKKAPPVLSPSILEEQNKKAIKNDPNISGKRKLRQLERHQRLHLLYEAHRLRKCLLSYFLLVVAPDRLKLLKWMGSDLAGDTPMPTADELPKLPLRLAKIPEEYGIGGDKGFTGIERDMPNCNDVKTPVHLQNSKTHRLSEQQIVSDIPITSVRAPCETDFSRTGQEDILGEKIDYYLIHWLPHGHALAHGEANLCMPLRYPGKNSIVGSDYWKNEEHYTRIQQPAVAAREVGMNERRPCSYCKQGGIVQFCKSCDKWYHPNDRCHDFDGCENNTVRNPYK